MHQSVATIDSPEFLNLQPVDINPFMSKCDIKVFYIGENRNMSYISEEAAQEIGKTLRGAPIVGYYKAAKEDFADHGEKVIIDDEGIKFECQTVPYGFVAPDAQVWFQNFEDFDSMGNSVVRKYLMTTGYLWTKQFPESSLPVEEGRPQSMELENVDGHWETSAANGMDFFIINDAIISKLCILGDDVEPCFEGASVTAPDVSTKFTLDDTFKHTLFSMMQDLKKVLDRGEQQMENFENLENPTAVEDQDAVATKFTQETSVESEVTEPVAEVSDPTPEETPVTEFTADPEQNEGEQTSGNDESAEKYAALEAEFNALQEKFTNLQTQYQELVNFKNEIDNQQKDALINEFYMLSDEDKADVIANKEKYSLDDIKAKLSVICFDKKINFNLNTKEEQDDNADPAMTYNLDGQKDNNSLPDWVKAVKEQEKLG